MPRKTQFDLLMERLSRKERIIIYSKIRTVSRNIHSQYRKHLNDTAAQKLSVCRPNW